MCLTSSFIREIVFKSSSRKSLSISNTFFVTLLNPYFGKKQNQLMMHYSLMVKIKSLPDKSISSS